MSEQRRTVLKMLTAGGLWMATAPLGVARAQNRRANAEPPTIAAPSDLQPLLAEILRGFEAETGLRPQIALGTAEYFYSQILEGAPFEMFLSSDEALVTKLVDAGKTEGRGDVYAIARLAFYVPSESPLKADNFLGDIRSALRDGRLQRFAIANPKADPYGRLAEEALRRKRVWEEIQPLLAVGNDVAQAAQIAISGTVQGALVAYSQAEQLILARGGRCVLVSETLCDPLRERMVLLKNASNTTRRFYRYMLSDRVKTLLRRYGFLIPAG